MISSSQKRTISLLITKRIRIFYNRTRATNPGKKKIIEAWIVLWKTWSDKRSLNNSRNQRILFVNSSSTFRFWRASLYLMSKFWRSLCIWGNWRRVRMFRFVETTTKCSNKLNLSIFLPKFSWTNKTTIKMSKITCHLKIKVIQTCKIHMYFTDTFR